jgi:hypothetical protein
MESTFFITPAAWDQPEFNPFHMFLYGAVEQIQGHTSTMDEAEAAHANADMVDNLLRIVASEIGVLIGLAAEPASAALEMFVDAVTRATDLSQGLKDTLPTDLQ